MGENDRRFSSLCLSEQSVSGRKRGRDACSPPNRPAFSAFDIAAALNKPVLSDEVLVKAVAPALRGAQRTRGFVPLETLAEALQCVLTSGASTELDHVLHQFSVDNVIFAADIVHAHPDEAAILCAALAVDPWNTICQAAACQVGNFNQVCLHQLPVLVFLGVEERRCPAQPAPRVEKAWSLLFNPPPPLPQSAAKRPLKVPALSPELLHRVQVPPSLQHALMFHKGRPWDLRHAWNLANAHSHNAAAMVNFSPSPLKPSPLKQRKVRRMAQPL